MYVYVYVFVGFLNFIFRVDLRIWLNIYIYILMYRLGLLLISNYFLGILLLVNAAQSV